MWLLRKQINDPVSQICYLQNQMFYYSDTSSLQTETQFPKLEVIHFLVCHITCFPSTEKSHRSSEVYMEGKDKVTVLLGRAAPVSSGWLRDRRAGNREEGSPPGHCSCLPGWAVLKEGQQHSPGRLTTTSNPQMSVHQSGLSQEFAVGRRTQRQHLTTTTLLK